MTKRRSKIHHLGSTTKPRMSSLRLTIARTRASVTRSVIVETAGVAAVGPDEGQQVVAIGDLVQQNLGDSVVADIRAGDHHAQ
jgi:hypothetical protein